MSREERKHTKTMSIFAKRLKELVDNRTEDISQKELCKAIGISASQYFNYANDYRTPTIDTLSSICKYFSVSADYMLDENIKTPSLSKSEKIASDTIGLSGNTVRVLGSLKDSHKELLDRICKITINDNWSLLEAILTAYNGYCSYIAQDLYLTDKVNESINQLSSDEVDAYQLYKAQDLLSNSLKIMRCDYSQDRENKLDAKIKKLKGGKK